MQRVTTSQRRRLDFKRLFLAQLAMIVLVMLIAAWWSGWEAVVSALVGGMISLLPSLYFVWRGTRQQRGKQQQRNVLNLYQAAMGKFGLTVALFALAFVVVPPSNPAFFFVAYVVAQLMHWLTPWLVRERSTP
ncbi:ATP synthase subunit I [Halomonas sp. NPDC076908]|uniref:ATP synthase subunit I n=1 Tax=Halomonas sp. NPDC076908 TaxID=3390567 RepID=UPI003CFFB36E